MAAMSESAEKPPLGPSNWPWEKQKDREWRARILFVGYAVLPTTFSLPGVASCSWKEVLKDEQGRRHACVDFTFVSEDIETAYYEALDMAEELADRIAFLSFSPITYRMISVTYPVVAPGELFEIALPLPMMDRTAVDITAAELAQFDKSRSDAGKRALRLLRTGLTTESQYHALAQLWASSEVIARERAEQDGQFTKQPYPCKKCGGTIQGPPSTLPYVAKAFSAALQDEGKADEGPIKADETRRIRGKVVHGGRLQDAQLRAQVGRILSPLACATMVGVSDALGAKASVALSALIGETVLISQHTAHPLMGNENAIASLTAPTFKFKLEAHFAMAPLPKAYGRDQPMNIWITGFKFPMNIPHEVWPAISSPATP